MDALEDNIEAFIRELPAESVAHSQSGGEYNNK